MVPRETENNAYAKFWGDEQRALWYVMVFSGVVNLSLTCSKSCYRCLPYQKRGQESCKFQFSLAPANVTVKLVWTVLWPK